MLTASQALNSGDTGEGRSHGAALAVPACALADGLHIRGWTELDLPALLPAWRHLAAHCATPNPFFEDWFLIPSLQAYDPQGAVRLALLVERGRLVALTTHWRDPNYHGRKLANLAPWHHPNMFCALPLVARGFETAFWRALLADTDASAQGAWFYHFPSVPRQSPVTRALVEICTAGNRQFREVRSERRAMLRAGPTPQAHLDDTMTAKKRKELRRQRKRLEDHGAVEVIRSRDESGLHDWIAKFIELEKRGWKGKRGSALASDPRGVEFFTNALAGAAAQGRLERLAIACNGRPVAMLATFISAPGSFAFKTSFDEEFARFSPGMLLQVENLALLDNPAIAWCDSCAAADHPMIERIWRDRREMIWLSVGIGGGVRRTAGEFYTRIEARRARKDR